MIDLTVKTLDARNHEFSVNDESTVSDLKKLIAERIGLSADVQRLIFRGRVLADASKLRELDVGGKVVHLVEREPPTPGQRANPGGAEQQRSRNRQPGITLGGAITQTQMENVLLEAIGIRGLQNEGGGGAAMGFRGLGGDDRVARTGPTLLRLSLIRRMLDHITSNITALQEAAADLPNLSNDPPSTAASQSTSSAAEESSTTPRDSSPAAYGRTGDLMATETIEEESLATSEEWLDATDSMDSALDAVARSVVTGPQDVVNTRNMSTITLVGVPDTQTDEQRSETPPLNTETEEQMPLEQPRQRSCDAAAVERELATLQQQLSTELQLSMQLQLYAGALEGQNYERTERMQERQRMVRRMANTVQGLSHLLNSLSENEEQTRDQISMQDPTATLDGEPNDEQRSETPPFDETEGQMPMEQPRRQPGEEMATLARELASLQRRLSIQFQMFADALTERHVEGSQRMRARQRMVRRMTDTMHSLSHLYHSLSDIEVTLTEGQPQCLSISPPRRVQIPIQTQINVMSNRRQPTAASFPQPTAPQNPATAPPAASVTVASSNTAPPTAPPQTVGEPQTGRQPTVHVDIRPEPLMYQVEIETRVPIAFAINSGGRQPTRPAGADAAVPAAAPVSEGAAETGGAPEPERTPAGPPPTGQQPPRQAQQLGEMLMDQGSDFIMGVSLPINWENAGQGQPHMIAGPFPFGGGGGAADLIQSMVQTALSQEPNGPAAAAQPRRAHRGRLSQLMGQQAARARTDAERALENRGPRPAGGRPLHRGFMRRPLRHPQYPQVRNTIFDRFLPCRYDQLRRARIRTRMENATQQSATARYTSTSSFPPLLEPSVDEVVNTLRGFTISDFVDMEIFLPGESWLIDMLVIISRFMTASELVAAWSIASPDLLRVRAPLQNYVRSTFSEQRPRSRARTMHLYKVAADALIETHASQIRWVEYITNMNVRVDLAGSLRMLLLGYVPQILLTMAESPREGDGYTQCLVALVSRLFFDVCSLVYHAARDRGTPARAARDGGSPLLALFCAYVDEFLQHLDPTVTRRLVDLITPFVVQLSDDLMTVDVERYIIMYPQEPEDARANAPQGSGPPQDSTARQAAGSGVGDEPSQSMDQDSSPPRRARDLSRGRFSFNAMGSVRPRLISSIMAAVPPSQTASPPAPPVAPRQRSTSAPDSTPPQADGEDVAAPPNMRQDWVMATRRDAARQRIAGAEVRPYSDAYLSGAPPRKRKLLTQGKPHPLSHMMQDCIREATSTLPPPEGVPDLARAPDAAAVRRAYWHHIRELARARIANSEDCTRERYPASCHYFACANKRPFPEDSTE